MHLTSLLTTFFLLVTTTLAIPISLTGNLTSSSPAPSSAPAKFLTPPPFPSNSISNTNSTNIALPSTNYTTIHTLTVTTPSSPRPLCMQNQRFTLGYEVCTFAIIIDETFTAELWIFDANCVVIGSATGVSVPYTGDGGQEDVLYNLDSSLKYVAVTDLKNGTVPVDMWYMGKKWGGDESDCWEGGDAEDSGETWYGCSFEFDC